MENLNYFIDQFTNLHAVCNKALDVDESSEELQLVLNVLSQDLQQIEEAASQEQFSDADHGMVVRERAQSSGVSSSSMRAASRGDSPTWSPAVSPRWGGV